MTRSAPAQAAVRRPQPPAPPSSPDVPPLGITVYGCEPDEAALFGTLAPGLGVTPTITEAPVTDDNIRLALGNRCISIGHKTQVTNATLRALSSAGVTYISTRSVGCNHLDVQYADSV